MATRKQKHAAAVAKREAFMKKYREDGLKALEAERERLKLKETEALVEAQKLNKLGRNLAAINVVRKLKKDELEITVGDYLHASNKMLPVFSDQ